MSARGRDLGTYHVRVMLRDGRGFIMSWETGRRFNRGKDGWSPLDADEIGPPFGDDQDVINNIKYMFGGEGNYSCDCNLELFWRYSQQLPGGIQDCGHTLGPAMVEVMRPNKHRWDVVWRADK